MTWTSTTVYPNAFFTSQADYCHKSSRESRAGVTSPSSSLPEPSKTSLEPDSSFCTPLLSIAGIAIIEVNNNNNYFITLFNEYKNITGCPVVYAKALLLIHPWEPRGKILSLVSHYQKKYPWVQSLLEPDPELKFNMVII